jgi:hypothetical protein
VDFVNSFSFIFSGVSREVLLGHLFSWYESAKLKGYTENWTEPACEPRQAGRPGPTGPRGSSGGSPPIFPWDVPFRLPSLVRKFEGKFEKGKCGF